MSALLRLGPFSEALYAAAAIVVLGWVNLRGMRSGALTQTWLTAVEVLGLLLVVVAGLYLLTQGGGAAAPAAAAADAPGGGGAPGWSAFGLAMVFVLLTYGGWNEAAYLGAELRDVSRNMVRALLISVGLITALYLLVNWAYLYGLGLEGMARSNAVAADLLAVAFGRAGESLVAIMVAVASVFFLVADQIIRFAVTFVLGIGS